MRQATALPMSGCTTRCCRSRARRCPSRLGNFFTVRDLLDQGVPGEVIRFVMLSTHYRKPMDWTEKKRAEAEKTLTKWYAACMPTRTLQRESNRPTAGDCRSFVAMI